MSGAAGARRIGPYRLLRLLGAGGMGEVHLARADDGRHVALKLVHPEFAEDPAFRARFRQEVDAAGKVLSFFTVPLVDAGPDDPTPWLATQYVAGPSLTQEVRAQGPLPLGRLCTLAAALGEALVVVHAAGIVHRDLKPSNVLLAEDGPRVIDFGIARAADSAELTGTGMVVGTLGYASPEQLTGEPEVGPASDLYSLGAVLLFAATGEPPFRDAPAATLAYWTVHDSPDTSGVPPELLELVRACLAHDPAARPTPAQVIAAARAAQSLHPPGAPPGPPPPPPPPPSAPDTRPPAAAPAPGRIRTLARRPAAAVGLAAAVVLAVLLAIGLPLLPERSEGAGTSDGPAASPSPESPAPERGTDKPRRAAPEPSGPAADSRTDVVTAGGRERVWRTGVDGGKDETTVIGGWLTPHAAARTDALGTRGLDPADGKELWHITPPRGTKQVCAASQGRSATADGVGAVRYGADSERAEECAVVGAVDTRTGKRLWQREVGVPNNGKRVLGMSGGSLVTVGKDGLLGLDPRTGKERWHRTDGIDNCSRSETLPGPRTLTVLEQCGRGASPDTVVELDSATGKERWRFTLPRNVTEAHPVTAEPASVSLGRGGDGSKDALLVFDRSGKHHHEVARKSSRGTMELVGGELYERPRVAVHGDTMVLTISPPNDILSGLLASIDTRTGKYRWHRQVPFGNPTIVGLDGDSATVLAAHGLDEPVRLIEYRLTDGELLDDGSLPAEFADPTSDWPIAVGTRVLQLTGRVEPGATLWDVPDSD